MADIVGTTAKGTPYRVRNVTAPDAGNIFYGVADANLNDPDLLTILYTHGAGGGSSQFATLSAWAGFREWLIDNGHAWMESTGGGLQPWGNDASRLAYEATFTKVSTLIDVGEVVILGRSMGGLVAQWLFTQSTVLAARSLGAIINSGTQNLAATYAAGDRTDELFAAYGVNNEADYLAAVVGRDPIAFDPALWTGKNIIQLAGTADTTVPPTSHAYAIREHYQGRPALDLLSVRAGGDHSGSNGSYLEVDAMVGFLAQIVPEVDVPEPPVPPSFFRIKDRYFMDVDGKHRIVPSA